MNQNDLYKIVAQMMESGKGILAADESDGTAGKRLEMVHLPNEIEHRRAFRELLFTAPGIEEYLSGVILYDSTIRGETKGGVPFADVLAARGIIPGIKVDTGTVPLEGFDGEVVTEGLDGLADRFKEYYTLGARFAKWRAVITIDGDTLPSDECLEINAIMLARYAALAQAAGIVPMVEPEVIFAGNHSLQRAEEVTTRALQILFTKLRMYRVDFKGLILKTSMVLAGDMYKTPSTPEEVADSTLRTLRLGVPHDVGGIVFLSGGQAPKRATENLHAIAKMGKQPWPISSSFSRALEEPVLTAWQGKDGNIEKAQQALLYRTKMNSLAQQGKYNASEDKG
ncbi:fructose-bisphosphate aldolase class I [Candidatus Parcubacteria bacterium]|uniref:Probable fructose-bisphosphate aldolase class 1 n=1 Tax=Candidatus Kaiserbacteria bacterium CG10_big_fil_rev_8_21_14_0_10_47_16 TaxID=1974608 RepID=A0A2H0UDF3_9BACT|nr:fructose-bisphosphate aldolase class I [Candidatus Parcubacteria bacterium]PIR84421.1 MAG: fructose-bisphosphate aldolase class I [Candidatus Kaiserbacteria bacterium CG10_big_fil_rev_8_21_14_0_10_47_16]